jgi:glycolate oxidase
VAKDDADRARIWKGRKSAFSAVGRLSPDYIVQDGVVPRSRLGEALATIERLSRNTTSASPMSSTLATATCTR